MCIRDSALSMLLHYLGKLKNQTFAILMHVKSVKCDFLSSIQLMSAKCHEKYQHFAFCSFTVLNVLKECLVVVWSDFQQVIIDFAVDQWRKCLQAFVHANGGHVEHLLWINSWKQFAFFICFWFKWLPSIVSAFYCVDAWWPIGLPCLTAKL